MSNYLQSKAIFDAISMLSDTGFAVPGETASERAAADLAVDAALRNVQLPEGLLTRLGKLVYTTPDDIADQVDWLGC